jgi:BCD family chlorophyll transporter-like MFS transporter
VLNSLALWKQESAPPGRVARPPPGDAELRPGLGGLCGRDGTRRRLVAIGLGTMAFGMQDVLLEPYGGQVLGMSVGATTWLTATLAGGGLARLRLASSVLGRGADPARMALAGAWLGMPAFAAVITGGHAVTSVPLFARRAADRLRRRLFGHGTLTMTMNRAPTRPDRPGAGRLGRRAGHGRGRGRGGWAACCATPIYVMSGLVGDTRRLLMGPQDTHLPVGPDLKDLTRP